MPEEILTDQGSNFTSGKTVSYVTCTPNSYKPLSSPPDGPVERFNRTLKSMLRKSGTQEGKDWDKLLPYLLFAYREVPQASTGFSPFDGWPVRGPLDVLLHTWESADGSDDSVVSHVLSVREKLSKMSDLVHKNLSKAQDKQK